MQHTITKFIFISLLICSIISVTSCGTSAKEDDPKPAVKALNKTTFAPKKWYSQGGAFIHDFKAGGAYNATGTWKWKNNSDTLEIVSQAGYSPTFWKVYWNTDTEMECEKITTFTKLLYKDEPW